MTLPDRIARAWHSITTQTPTSPHLQNLVALVEQVAAGLIDDAANGERAAEKWRRRAEVIERETVERCAQLVSEERDHQQWRVDNGDEDRCVAVAVLAEIVESIRALSPPANPTNQTAPVNGAEER